MDFELYEGMFYCKVNTIHPGGSFDDKIIFQQRKQSGGINASDTMKCEDQVVLATMDIRNFHRAVKKIETRRTTKLVDFFYGIPCFQGMTHNLLAKFTNFLKKQKFIRNQIVYKEGTPAHFAFIVVKGEFELQKSLTKTQGQSELAVIKLL